MPGTEVAIGLNSPASFVPGFRSNVSLWDGPPSIHRTMQDLVFLPVWAACVARTLSQPDADRAAAPTVDILSQSRRERFVVIMMVLSRRKRRVSCSPRPRFGGEGLGGPQPLSPEAGARG